MDEYDPGVEGDGRYLVATVESAGDVSPVFERKLRRMAEERFGTVDADRWYPINEFVSFFHDLEAEVGEKTLRQGGIENAKVIPWPDGVDSVREAMETINDLHQQATRGADEEYPIGRYTVGSEGSTALRVGVTERFPHPESYTQGILKGVVEEFEAGSRQLEVESVSPNADEKVAWRLSW